MRTILHDVENHRTEWLELRRQTIGSSDIATLCGLNVYKSVLELWAEKTGKIEPFDGNDATWLGTKMEPIIGELFKRRNPSIRVEKCNEMYGHDEYPFAISTPDFNVSEEPTIVEGDGSAWRVGGFLETKNASYRKLREWHEHAPTWAQVQLQWQLGVCGLSYGYVAGLVGANVFDFKQYRCEFSPVVWDMCLQLAGEFMEYVQKDIPPSAGPGDKELVEKLVGDREKGVRTALPIDAYPVVREYLKLSKIRSALNKQVSTLKEQTDELEARILQLMGSAEVAEGWGVTIKATRINQPERKQSAYSYTRLYPKGELEQIDESELPNEQGLPIPAFEDEGGAE